MDTRNEIPLSFWSRWHFSIITGLIYILTFHLWYISETLLQVQGIGLASALFLCVYLGKAQKNKYFRSSTEIIGYALVILDILLEAFLIYPHDHFGFYWCAFAFAAVLAPYRVSISKAK